MCVSFKDLMAMSALQSRRIFSIPGVGAHLDTSPSLLPIPALDGHIVTTRQDETERWVDCQTTDVIRVRLE